jgi:hypothetical protein
MGSEKCSRLAGCSILRQDRPKYPITVVEDRVRVGSAFGMLEWQNHDEKHHRFGKADAPRTSSGLPRHHPEHYGAGQPLDGYCCQAPGYTIAVPVFVTKSHVDIILHENSQNALGHKENRKIGRFYSANSSDCHVIREKHLAISPA